MVASGPCLDTPNEAQHTYTIVLMIYMLVTCPCAWAKSWVFFLNNSSFGSSVNTAVSQSHCCHGKHTKYQFTKCFLVALQITKLLFGKRFCCAPLWQKHHKGTTACSVYFTKYNVFLINTKINLWNVTELSYKSLACHREAGDETTSPSVFRKPPSPPDILVRSVRV